MTNSNSESHSKKIKILTLIVVLLLLTVVVQFWFLFVHDRAAWHSLMGPKNHAELMSSDRSFSSWFDRPFDANDWDPFHEMQQMQDHMNKMFNDSLTKFNASNQFSHLFNGSKLQSDLTVQNESDRFIISMSVPDSTADNLNVDIQAQQLTISGTITKKSRHHHNTQTYSSTFSRSVTLPEPIDPASMHSSFTDGVLQVVIRKAAAT